MDKRIDRHLKIHHRVIKDIGPLGSRLKMGKTNRVKLGKRITERVKEENRRENRKIKHGNKILDEK